MDTVLRIGIENDETMAVEVERAIDEAGTEVRRSLRTRGGFPTEIVVALGSAGAFTALYQIISNILEKDKNRELTIERDGNKITLKGHTLPEEKQLLRELAPDLIGRTVLLPDKD